jgi:hypothetical protein
LPTRIRILCGVRYLPAARRIPGLWTKEEGSNVDLEDSSSAPVIQIHECSRLHGRVEAHGQVRAELEQPSDLARPDRII